MIDTSTIENLSFDDPDYKYGFIVDSLSEEDESGTVINGDFHNDWLTVFGRSTERSKTVPNGNRDNEVDGYQLYESLFGTQWIGITPLFGFQIVTNNEFKYRFISGGSYVHVKGYVEVTSLEDGIIFTLSETLFPVNETMFLSVLDSSSSIVVEVNSFPGSLIGMSIDDTTPIGSKIYIDHIFNID